MSVVALHRGQLHVALSLLQLASCNSVSTVELCVSLLLSLFSCLCVCVLDL